MAPRSPNLQARMDVDHQVNPAPPQPSLMKSEADNMASPGLVPSEPTNKPESWDSVLHPGTPITDPTIPVEGSHHTPRYRLMYTLSGHARSVSALKFSPDGAILASSGVSYRFPLPITCQLTSEAADKAIKLWDALTGDILKTMIGHTEGISDIAWSSDGEYLASASDDKTIIIWSTELVWWIYELLLARVEPPSQGKCGEDPRGPHEFRLLR